MKLPNYEFAIVAEAKIVAYLLNLESENGAPKARFFMAFGFTIEAWENLAKALLQHASIHDVAKIESRPPFGVHYVVEGTLQTPDGRNPAVRVIWSIDTDRTIPRLISAYPL
jgi:hypothetical protein